MDLLKQITEDIKSYHNHIHSLVEKIEQFEETISLEKRLGLRETAYYQQDVASGKPAPGSVEFQPQPGVAKPQQVTPPPKGPGGTNAMTGRIQLMYNPATGRVEDAKQASGMHTPPAPGYVVANAQQLDAALAHINSIDKALADKIVAGQVQVFVPQNPNAPKATPNVQQHGGMNKIEMDPTRLAAANKAAGEMSLA
jgi:hypothetical protein